MDKDIRVVTINTLFRKAYHIYNETQEQVSFFCFFGKQPKASFSFFYIYFHISGRLNFKLVILSSHKKYIWLRKVKSVYIYSQHLNIRIEHVGLKYMQ